jgi:hypothetical protein
MTVILPHRTHGGGGGENGSGGDENGSGGGEGGSNMRNGSLTSGGSATGLSVTGACSRPLPMMNTIMRN